jgi:transposase
MVGRGNRSGWVVQMRGRPFRVDWQGEDSAEALKRAYQAERDATSRQRLQALWLLRQGWTLGAVAEATGAHYRSVQRWVAWYRTGGVAAVRAHPLGGKGQVPFLNAAAQAEVADAVATGRFRTAAEIGDWIAATYGVTYTLGGIYSLLDRLKCAPKVPRPLHQKADLVAQARFKKGGSSRRWRRPA